MGPNDLSPLNRPIWSRPNDIPVGMDDLGNRIFQGVTGRRYTVQPQVPTYQAPKPDYRRVTRTDAQGRTSHDFVDAKTPDFGIAERIMSALTNGFRTPGRALRGEPVTYGDMLDTASMVQLGAAAMPAPRGALRSGALRVADDAAETPAQVVARMLREGRAADVTDDLMAQTDPQEMWRLYQSGATGADMPMDAASRMARARKAGFGSQVYHATDDAFDAFDDAYLGANTKFNATDYDEGSFARNLAELGHWTNERPLAGTLGQDVDMPLTARGKLSREKSLDALDNRINRAGGVDNVRQSADGFRVADEELGGLSTVIVDPSNIRSRFARFDPRLSHLRNLSAGVGGLGLMTMLAPDEKEKIRSYLGGI